MLTRDDKEWVKDMIELSVRRLALELPKNCPVMAKMKFGMFGIGIGLVLAGGSAGMWIIKFLQ